MYDLHDISILVSSLPLSTTLKSTYASSLAKKTAARATSSGVPNDPHGCIEATMASFSAVANGPGFVKAVLMKPGQRQLQWILSFA